MRDRRFFRLSLALSAAAVLLLAVPIILAQNPSTPRGAAATGVQNPAPPAAPQTASAGVLDRLRGGGPIRVGYRTDAQPFSFNNESGVAAGYSVELCRRVVEAVRGETGARDLVVDWVPLGAGERFEALAQKRIDVLCGAETVTLSRRAEASFSIPIFPGGVGALVRADAPARLREALAGRGQARPVWRAQATQAVQSRFLSAVQGTTAERWLVDRIGELQIIASVSRQPGYDAAVQALVDRRTDVLFGERAILFDAARRHRVPGDLVVIDRLFTYEPLALGLPRGDDSLRLVVDRTLSRLAASGELGRLYTTWFAEPDDSTLTFFRWNALPE